jgi:DNA-binding NtrC family response regulator
MHPRLPVIAMSGTVNQSDEGIAKFASALLPKPFEAQTLLEIVRRTLDRAGSAGPFQTKI